MEWRLKTLVYKHTTCFGGDREEVELDSEFDSKELAEQTLKDKGYKFDKDSKSWVVDAWSYYEIKTIHLPHNKLLCDTTEAIAINKLEQEIREKQGQLDELRRQAKR